MMALTNMGIRLMMRHLTFLMSNIEKYSLNIANHKTLKNLYRGVERIVLDLESEAILALLPISSSL